MRERGGANGHQKGNESLMVVVLMGPICILLAEFRPNYPAILQLLRMHNFRLTISWQSCLNNLK